MCAKTRTPAIGEIFLLTLTVTLAQNTHPRLNIGAATTILGNSDQMRCVALVEVVARVNMPPKLLLAKIGLLVAKTGSGLLLTATTLLGSETLLAIAAEGDWGLVAGLILSVDLDLGGLDLVALT